MRRFLMAKLEKWHEKTNRKPLVLSGARQVGKTWLLNEFGRTHFGNVAYVNFDKTEAAKELFGGGFDFKGIIAGLQAVCNVEIKPHDTLIVFDEIQTCPSALKLLKYWQEDFPEYCVAAAGSLIGLALMEGTGYPVGKTDSMTLYPMCFREFLEATGEERLSELVASGDGKLWNAFHDTLSRRLKDYLLVGGMPAAVAAFAANRSYAAAREVQNGILSDYDRDFGKHAPKVQIPRIRAIWRSLPAQLAKEDKRFVSAEVPSEDGSKSRARDLRDPFEWLEAAGVAYRVWNVSKPSLPLDSYRNHIFKLFGVDVGLLGAQSRIAPETVVDGSRIFTEFKGAMSEQYVQQEIRAVADVVPYFWTSPDSRCEIDFLSESAGAVVPIEAKAEVNLRAKSLKAFRERFSSPLSVRTSLAPWRPQEGLLNVPLYAIGDALASLPYLRRDKRD